MTRALRPIHFPFTINLRRAAALATILMLARIVAPPAWAQTFTVIYNFTGQNDGGVPDGVLAMDGEEISMGPPPMASTIWAWSSSS